MLWWNMQTKLKSFENENVFLIKKKNRLNIVEPMKIIIIDSN